jgi:hypothetical protein
VPRSIHVRDSDSGADDLWCSNFEFRSLDSRQKTKPFEVGPVRQVENLLDDLIRRDVQSFFTGKCDWPHILLLLDGLPVAVSFAADDRLWWIFWKSLIGLRQTAEQETRVGAGSNLPHLIAGFTEASGKRG